MTTLVLQFFVCRHLQPASVASVACCLVKEEEEEEEEALIAQLEQKPPSDTNPLISQLNLACSQEFTFSARRGAAAAAAFAPAACCRESN
jgi:hypothetical protein